MSDAGRLAPDLADRALERLGFAAPPPTDPDGLAELYSAWCRLVPFDNVRKLIALHRADPGPLPGLEVDDFFRSWLAHGVGGTCWPSSWALYSLVAHCGFTVRPVAASMFDAGIPSHGTAIVTIGGTQWLVDSSMLYGAPLRLDPGGRTAVDHPTWHTTAEPVAEGWLFQFARNEDAGHIPCRTISPDAVTHAFSASRYEWSRENSPFNTQVYLRRNRGDTMLSYAVGTRLARTGEAVVSTELAGDGLAVALVDEMGLSGAIVEQLVAAVDLS